LAGEKIQSVLTQAPGNGAPIGGLKVSAQSGWFAARPSGTEDIYKIYAESFQGADHLRRILEEAQTIVSDALAPSPPNIQPQPSEQNRRRNHERTKPRPEATYGYLPKDIEGFDSLAELALDMRWSWNHATDQVWRQLDPTLWELTQNPWVVLQTVSRDQLKRVLAIRPSARTLMICCEPSVRRSKRRPGFSNIIRSLPCPASPISAWNSC
jgi:hypothetical protein